MDRPTRVFDLIYYQLERYSQEVALAYKVAGEWKTFSTADAIAQLEALALGLRELGIGPGDRVANVAETNRPEWNFIDAAVMSLGAVHVPLYPDISVQEYEFILQESGARVLFVSSARLFTLLQPIADKLPGLQAIYTYDPVPGAEPWTVVRAAGERKLATDGRDLLRQCQSRVAAEDLATLIYTSGTTGTPKGVMLSHANLVSNCTVCAALLQSSPEERALSFLPLCHIYERTVINIYIVSGTSVYYAENLHTIGENLREVKPHIFSSVPRLLEKIYERIIAKGEELTRLKRSIFFWALELGLQHDPLIPQGLWRRVQLALADRLVFCKWREAIGGQVRGVISGSAALQTRLARVFWAAGIPVYEGYGPTEAGPVIAVNRLADGPSHIGTVGKIIEGGEVRIAEDGEILYRGPNVMLGYFKRPDLTRETIDTDGWLHTGDVGELDGEYLKITDRKKEIFKTTGGKYIAPQQIENRLKESRFISQVMVVGENHKFPAALIVPAFEAVADALGKPEPKPDELARDPETTRLVQADIDQFNVHFGRYMQVKKFVLLPNEWSISGGELTPTLKLKRKQIVKKYAAEIAALYKGEEHCAETLDEHPGKQLTRVAPGP
jgi:long-chain acyl-CoA synthetase